MTNKSRSWRTLAALFTLLSLAGTALQAQCKDSDFPGREGVLAAPSRPTESSSPDPVQTGVVQVEMGWQHAWPSQNTSADAFSNLVKLGVWCNAEIRWSGNSFMRSGTGTTAINGVGDNLLTGQYRFLRESRRRPSTALGYSVKSPTASVQKGLGSGHVDQAATLMMGKSIHGFSNLFNATYFSIGGAGGAQGKGELTLGTSRMLTRGWGVIGEVFGDTRLNAGNDSYITTFAVNYLYRGWLVFDVGANLPLTAGPGNPGNAVFGGMTYAIADLYRRRRQ